MKKDLLILAGLCLILVNYAGAQVPGSISIQGKLSPATPVNGACANLLRDNALVKSLPAIDLVPAANGVFVSAINGLSPEDFVQSGEYAIRLSQPDCVTVLATIPLRSVPFSFAAGTLVSTGTISIDAGTLSIDTINKRVGVGTAAPEERLHVNGNAKFDGSIMLKDVLNIETHPGNFDGANVPVAALFTRAIPETLFTGPLSATPVIIAPKNVSTGGEAAISTLFLLNQNPEKDGNINLNEQAEGISGLKILRYPDEYGIGAGQTWFSNFGKNAEGEYRESDFVLGDNGFSFHNWSSVSGLPHVRFQLSPYGMSFDKNMYFNWNYSFPSGATTPTFYITGNLEATGTKSFIQPYPGDPNRIIQYYSMEGPEAGIYTRGTANLVRGKAVVKLPENFTLVASTNVAPTVQVTARGNCRGLFVAKSGVDKIEVQEFDNGENNVAFDYLVQTVRKGYENMPVIQDKKAESGQSEIMGNPLKERLEKLKKRGK